MRILVVYASRHGATRGIAERIAATLDRSGLDVTLRRAEDPGPVDGYGAFVVGSAAYLGRWLEPATSFIRRHRDTLADRPVWLFSSGPTSTEAVDSKGRNQLEVAAPKEFAEYSGAIRPRDERVFFGAYDPAAEPAGLAESLMARFMRIAPAARNALPAGDFRDWPAIEAWAEEIARDLRPDGAPA